MKPQLREAVLAFRFVVCFCNLVFRRGLYILHPCSACLYLISAPWHFIVPACKYWNLHPIVSGYYAYLKVTVRARRRESLHERTRKHVEKLHGFRTGAKQLFPIVKVSVISSKGVFDIKELQVFQADLQVNRMSEYFDLAASRLIFRFSRFPLISK